MLSKMCTNGGLTGGTEQEGVILLYSLKFKSFCQGNQIKEGEKHK